MGLFLIGDTHGSYFLSKEADVESRTSQALQEMLEAHQFLAWLFGYFHINREFLIGETKFRCSAEMSECNAGQDSRLDAAIQFSPRHP